MAQFPVSQAKTEALKRRMEKFGVKEEELEERFVRSSGPGGQNVNKVASCVMLHHSPSGVRVKCQESRTQGMNRYLARKILLDRIEEKILGEKSAQRQRISKVRRQKQRRKRRTKEKLLEQKRRRTEKKQRRRPPERE